MGANVEINAKWNVQSFAGRKRTFLAKSVFLGRQLWKQEWQK